MIELIMFATEVAEVVKLDKKKTGSSKQFSAREILQKVFDD